MIALFLYILINRPHPPLKAFAVKNPSDE